MDSKRFDGFAKTLARWSSRRKFLGGVAGAGAGALIRREEGVFAQQDIQCKDFNVDSSGDCTCDAIAGQLESLFGSMPLGDLCPPTGTSPQFCKFVKGLKALVKKGMDRVDLDGNAVEDSEKWCSNILLGSMRDAWEQLLDGVSVGVADAFYATPAGAPAGDIDGVQQVTPGSQPTICTSCALHNALKCMYDHPEDYCEQYRLCFIPFVRAYVGAEGATGDDRGCLQRFQTACGADCCAGGCHP
jgi:hypothetical protein